LVALLLFALNQTSPALALASGASEPVGRRIRIHEVDIDIVGIAGDGKYSFLAPLDEPSPPFLYLPFGQWGPYRVPHVRLEFLGTSVGFGVDPMSAGFGARRFAAGDGGHSDYFVPGGVALRAIAVIVRGWAS